ncbi:MAG: fructosamine kinase family protein [Planctomycetes bacterium]|nr:fructosamine kinase family protein [Planctomycetota bacterium]
MSRRDAALRAAFAAALEVPVATLELRPLSGGCINQAARCEVAGTSWFVKWNDRPLPGQFAAEAAGLAALADVQEALRIPRVLASSDEPGAAFLILEHLEPGSRGAGFDEALGRGLAALHRASAEAFGFACDGYCGATPQPNGWLPRWTDFYRERRLAHQLALARAAGFPADAFRAGQALLERLPEWLDDEEPPALIHGDLWSGNLYVGAGGQPALIDPAAYYGHREAELGMMSLFGGFSQRVFAAYAEAYPLRDGWRERLGLYELYHVLNHFNLFGGSYGGQAARLIQRYRV